MRRVTALLSLLMIAVLVVPAWAQEKPRSGVRRLVFAVPSEPPSYDGHIARDLRAHAPDRAFYNTLLRVDPNDPPAPSHRGAWPSRGTASRTGAPTLQAPARREVPRRQRDDLEGREGLLRQDHLPPAGMVRAARTCRTSRPSRRPDPTRSHPASSTPQGSFLLSVASPWNFIYKADILAKDMHWYEKNIMGTGPFTFVEHVKGSHWVGKKEPQLLGQGQTLSGQLRAMARMTRLPRWRCPWRARPHPVSRLQPAERDSSRRWRVTRSRCRRAPGTASSWWPSTTRRSRSTTSACVGRSPWPWIATRARRRSRDRHREGRWPGSRCRARRTRRRPRSWRSWPATGGHQRRPGGDLVARRPACRTASRSRSRTAASPCPTSLGDLADRPVAAGRAQRQQSRWSRRRRTTTRPSGRATSTWPWTSSAATSWSRTSTLQVRLHRQEPVQLRTVHGSNAGRALREAGAGHGPEERKKYVRAFEKRLLDEEVHYL